MTKETPSNSPYPTEIILDSEGSVLALIVRKNESAKGVHFVTPNDFQQQVALMNRPAGERILAHTHLPVPRSVKGTQEVLIIRSGRLRVEIYDASHQVVAREEAGPGDVIVLVDGGHGFTVIDDCDFVEVKQGPYVPGRDKVVFESNGQAR